MNIVMLGHSNAGKTTYMAMMYELMRSGYGGFRVRAADRHRDRELLATARAIRQGVYPQPSSRRDVHTFKLTHRWRTVADFTWSDYRGGALSSRSDDAEAEAVLSALVAADGLVLFVDAHRLATAESSRRVGRRLTVLLLRALDERPGPVPVVIAYTKADLVHGTEAWTRATTPLTALEEAVSGSGRVHGTTVAVSCGARPQGVHVPVLWCLSHHLTDRVAELQRAADRSLQLSKEAESRAGLWNSITSTVQGVESEYRKQLRYGQEAQAKLKELKPLEAPARRLVAALDRARADTAPPTAAGVLGGASQP